MAKMIRKHEVKLSALLASRPGAECSFHIKHGQGITLTTVRETLDKNMFAGSL